MSSDLRSTRSSEFPRTAKWVIAGLVALVGVGAAAYSVWPSARPEPPLPLDLQRTRSASASAPGGSPTAVPINLPAGATASVRTSEVHGEPPPPPPPSKPPNPPDVRTVKADASWDPLRESLARAIEAAALQVPDLTETKAKTAADLGKWGSLALMTMACTDGPRGMESLRELGATTDALPESDPALGRLAGLFEGATLDAANARVLKPPAVRRAGIPNIPPSSPGEKAPRRMMLSMTQMQSGEQAQTGMMLANPDIFPRVQNHAEDKLPAWEVRVPLTMTVGGEKVTQSEATVLMVRDAKTGTWQPASWGVVYFEPAAADLVMKSIRALAPRRDAAPK